MESRLRKKRTTAVCEDIISRKKKRSEFVVGEKILCYEPDEKLQKVLYDAKISDVYEISNKRGSSKFEYLVHFLGWNSSWDRKVSEDHLLKDTPSNRELQIKLAEKSSLQLGAYLYRKEQRKKRMKLNEKRLLLEGSDDAKKNELNELEYSSSSATESHDDDRVFLHVGEILKSHLEYDYKMICKENYCTKAPSPHPSVITILENFVKCYALKTITMLSTRQEQPKRRNSIANLTRKEQQKPKSIDFQEVANDINLCKETADGLRVYFNFILKDFLLYPEEKEDYERIMSTTTLKDVEFNNEASFQLEDFFKIPPSNQLEQAGKSETENSEMASMKLGRSCSVKLEEEEKNDKDYFSSMTSTSSCDSIAPQKIVRKSFFSKAWLPLDSSLISPELRIILEEAFNWEMVPKDCNDIEPAMIFGVYHLIRLIVKLPEFLTVSLINDAKMTILLKFLDEFVEFLEENTDLYGQKNYVKKESK